MSPRSPQQRHSEWSWILAELRPHRRRVAGLLSLSLAEIGFRMLLPWPLKAVVDHVAAKLPLPPIAAAALAPALAVSSRVITSAPVALLLIVIVAGLVLQLGHQLVLMGHTRLQARIGVRLVHDLRAQLFDHLQALALVHHDESPTGDAVYRLEADAGCIEQLTLGGVFPFVFSAMTLVVMLLVLASIDRRIAIASLAVVPVLFVWMRWRTSHVAPRARAAKDAESRMVASLYESFAAIRLVKSFARERYEGQRFARRAHEVMARRLDTSNDDSVFSLGVGVITAAGTGLVLGLGGVLMVGGAITPGTLIVAVTYLGFVYGPLVGIANTTGSIQHALASARRVHETLGMPREDAGEVQALEAPRLNGVVHYDAVSFGFDHGSLVLRDVSFTATPGQMVALVGPSGSGKTTLLSLMPRFREPVAGAIRIDGHDIREFRLQSLRRQIALVQQDSIVLSGTVADNLRYGRLDASDEDLESAARLANAHDFIAQLPRGYETTLAEAGRTLSGGQRQRLNLARAFVKDAPIVLLDEPTAALDTVSERQVIDALERLRDGRTTFVIAHRLSTVRNADVILVIDRGQIVASGRHGELVDGSPFYRELAASMIQ